MILHVHSWVVTVLCLCLVVFFVVIWTSSVNQNKMNDRMNELCYLQWNVFLACCVSDIDTKAEIYCGNLIITKTTERRKAQNSPTYTLNTNTSSTVNEMKTIKNKWVYNVKKLCTYVTSLFSYHLRLDHRTAVPFRC